MKIVDKLPPNIDLNIMPSAVYKNQQRHESSPGLEKSLGNASAVNHSIMPNYRLNGSDVTSMFIMLYGTPRPRLRSILTSESFVAEMFTAELTRERPVLAGGYFDQR